MTTIQRVAQVFGIGFLLAAVAGFVAAGASMDPHTATAPRALGLFPVNLIHNLIHLAFGVWGLAASRSWGASRTYCRAAGVIYLVLMVMGFISPDTFGLVPIGSHDIWLHAVLGIPLAYFGFTARSPVGAGARV
jgi:DMSO/TMAO reductase YedYZ heme-binding membrane subunit